MEEVTEIKREMEMSAAALQAYASGRARLPKALAQMGWQGLRKGQDKVVDCVMRGQDVVVLMNTSAGKSGCYIVPTLAMGWGSVIVSPLVSLMDDQEQKMRKQFNMRVAAIHSGRPISANTDALREWAAGNLQVLIVAPERMSNPEFRAAMGFRKPDLVAFDECFPGDVEILTRRGFVRFDELEDGQEVAQVSPDDKSLSYVLPTRVVRREHVGELVRLSSTRGINLRMTPNHDVLRYRTKDGSWVKARAADVKFNYLWRLLGAPTSKDGRDDLTPQERLQVAYQADGNRHSKTFAAFSFSRPRKIRRFLQLMRDGGFRFTEVKDKGPRRRFLVRDVPWLSKEMREVVDLSALSTAGCRRLVEEAVAWDGSEINDTMAYYSSSAESNVDFYQEACTLGGMRSRKTYQIDKRKESYKPMHRLFIRLGEPWIGAQEITKSNESYSGMVYCVEVPSGCIVVRSGGLVSVMGNCHTYAEWADTFRADYKFAGEFVKEICPRVVMALSATMPPDDEAIVRAGLGLQNAKRVFYYSRRTNLELLSEEWDGDRAFSNYILNNHPDTTIVYRASRDGCEELAIDLSSKDIHDRDIFFYHAKIAPAMKTQHLKTFMKSKNAIVLATCAFGLGIDKDNVRSVIHRELPATLEAYTQEAGRAGRDGNHSRCVTFLAPSTNSIRGSMIRNGFPVTADIERVIYHTSRKLNRYGFCDQKRADIASACGLSPQLMDPLMTFLRGERMIEYDTDVTKRTTLKFADIIPSLTPLQAKYRDAIVETGVEQPDSSYLVRFEDIADNMGREAETVRRNLKIMQQQGILAFEVSGSSKPFRILGGIKDIAPESLQRIEKAAAEARDNFEDVKTMHMLPTSDEKHAFLEQRMLATYGG